MAEKIEAGADADAYCGKCKLVLAHVIIAMRGKRPARVECKTCNAVHAYKEEAPRRAARRTTTRDKTAVAMAEYESLMEGRDMARAVKYKISQPFDLEDVMDHKTFGFGLVMRVLSDQKIEVTFQAGNKILVHGR